MRPQIYSIMNRGRVTYLGAVKINASAIRTLYMARLNICWNEKGRPWLSFFANRIWEKGHAPSAKKENCNYSGLFVIVWKYARDYTMNPVRDPCVSQKNAYTYTRTHSSFCIKQDINTIKLCAFTCYRLHHYLICVQRTMKLCQ